MFTRRPHSTLPRTVIVSPVWKRKPVATAAVIAIAILAIIARGAPRPDDDFSKYHDRVFTVVYVADGDTIDTPEVEGSRDGAMHYGAEASAFAKETLLDQEVRVLLSPEQTRDKYRRLLAYVYIAETGESYNELLITNGMAYADWRFPHPHKNEFKRIEREARRNKLGLWEEVTAEDMPEWRRRIEKTIDNLAR